jgi:VWFA-related protein
VAAALAVSAAAALVAQTAGQPVFRSGVEVVELAVVARDADGHLVGDLTQRDFEVFEEGARQEIVAFERVSVPVTPPDQPRTPAPPADVSTNALAGDARLFVLVLDSLHVDARRTRDVRRIATRFVERHLGPHDLAAILSPGARGDATQEFTSDKARLLAAIGNFGGQKLLSATLSRNEQSGKAGGGDMYEGRDPDDGERAYRAKAITNVLDALAGHLAGVERRRKALLFFSEGIDYNTEDIFSKVQRYSSEVAKAMDRSLAALARANVAVYAIDPRGLANAEGDLLEHPIYREAPSVSLSEPGVAGELAASLRGLRTLADATGGFAVTDTNTFDTAFDRIVRENSDYYVLGYVPARPVRSGEFRKVEVRTPRPGLQLVARKGYTAPPAAARRTAAPAAPGEPALPGPFGARAIGRSRPGMMSDESAAPVTRGLADGMSDLLASPLSRPGLPISVSAIPFRGDGKKATVTVIIELGAKGLAFTGRDGRFTERVELAQLTIDSSAHADNGRSTSLDLRLTKEELKGVQATGVRWVSRLELKPGRYQLRVAARAQGSGQSGMVVHEIDVPRFADDRVALSGIALTSLPSVLMVTRSETPLPSKLETPPSATRAFVRGDRLTAVAEVYAGPAAGEIEVTARVETLDGGSKMRAAQRFAVRAGKSPAPQASFAIPTASLAAGQYVLHVTARAQSSDPAERRVPFEVIDAPK